MSSTIQKLTKAQLIKPPPFVEHNTMYETIMGSIAYGVSTDDSDMDVYGFCVPAKTIIFSHLAGEIPGFGRQQKRFDSYIQHHIQHGKHSYDLQIFNIVKFFQLCLENNPNVIDSLFTPQSCVLHITEVGNLVREHRKEFLHKGAYHKFRGYAFSQLNKMSGHNRTGKRKEVYEQYGFDCKFAYHVARLTDECEQILENGDIDLQRSKEYLKAIRRGEVPEEEIRSRFSEKEKYLEKLYENSKLPYGPDEEKIKALLLKCLEHHYGSLSDCVVSESKYVDAIRKIQAIITSI